MFQQKKRLLLLLGSILLLGMLSISLSSYFVSKSSTRKLLVDSTLPLVGDTVYSEIQRDLLSPIFISSLMAHNTFVHDWAVSGEHDVTGMSRYLQSIMDEYGAFTSFFVSDQSHNYYHPSGILKQINVSEERDQWYFRFREQNKAYEINIDPDYANDDALAVFVNYRVVDEASKFLGVIGVGLAIDTLSALVADYSDTFNRVVYFVDASGEIQLSGVRQDGAATLSGIAGMSVIAAEILSNQEQGSYSYKGSAGKVYVNSRYIEQLGWFLIVEQNENLTQQPFTKALVFNLAMSLLIALVVLAIAHRVLSLYQKDLENSAFKDSLTGVYNRQSFEDMVEKAFNYRNRKTDATSILFLDIDHFKLINDNHGHQAGDRAICHVVETIQKALRTEDIVCRWGGEEFCVLLKNTTETEANIAAQKVCDLLRESPLQYQTTTINMTISIGVGEYSSGESSEDFFLRLDKALYIAKESGRDQVYSVVVEKLNTEHQKKS